MSKSVSKGERRGSVAPGGIIALDMPKLTAPKKPEAPSHLLALGLHWGRNGLTFAASGAGLYGLSRLLPGDPIKLVVGADSFTAGPWPILAIGGAIALAKLGGRR